MSGPVRVSKTDAFVVHGHTTHTVTGSDTLESIAHTVYGDASLAYLIAMYNTIADNDELVPGKNLKIPALRSTSQLTDNQVFDETGDVYGRDVKIDARGKVVIGEHGDYMTVEGPQNVVQAINQRLNHVLGSRVRLNMYGLMATVGESGANNAPVVYFVTNLLDTVMQDPRIVDVYNISIRGHKEKLYYSFTATIIGQNTVQMMGVF